ncbi:MAG: hypothetical protein C4518_04900 [Desulfobacteraceae bacterium]|nr:MAG: hypothetical protein C4518_04900 [Desulfobacteraceae bacterium]
MEKNNKTRPQYVLDALTTGKSLLAIDITQMVSEASGEEVKIQDIGSLMTKIQNIHQFQIGYFIKKKKTRHAYEYRLVHEILALAPKNIYGLTRKTGKNRFTLEMALKKIPALEKYVNPLSQTIPEAESKPWELPVIQKANENVVAVFLNEIEKIGGLRVNFYLKLRLKK